MSSSQVLRQYTHRKTKQTKHKQQKEKKTSLNWIVVSNTEPIPRRQFPTASVSGDPCSQADSQ